MRALFLGLAVLATGCVTVEKGFSDSVSSEGVFVFQGDTEFGDIAYDGSAITEVFDIRGVSHGFGSSKRKAERREEGNDYLVERRGEFLVAAASSRERRAGVDFDIQGPGLMHMDVIALEGQASLFNVEGTHVVTANRVFARNVIGDADFFADGRGMDVEIFPYQFGVVRLQATGDTDVYLPRGLDYDITVVSDPDRELLVEELGFDTLILEPGLAIGRRGGRSVFVDIEVFNGDVRILSAN